MLGAGSGQPVIDAAVVSAERLHRNVACRHTHLRIGTGSVASCGASKTSGTDSMLTSTAPVHAVS